MKQSKFTIKRNHCDCHPETCCHFDYYIFIKDKRIVGSDSYDFLVEFLKDMRDDEAILY